MDEAKIESFMAATLGSLQGLRQELHQEVGGLRQELSGFRQEVNTKLDGITKFLLASERNVGGLTSRVDSLELRVDRLEDRDKSA